MFLVALIFCLSVCGLKKLCMDCYLLGKGGYVSGSVGLSVCLSVCEQHYSKRTSNKYGPGILHNLDSNKASNCHLFFRVYVHGECLTHVDQRDLDVESGDLVFVISDLEKVKKNQEAHGGWNDDMKAVSPSSCNSSYFFAVEYQSMVFCKGVLLQYSIQNGSRLLGVTDIFEV